MQFTPEQEKRHQYLLTRPTDGQSLKTLIEAGLTWLRTNQQLVNTLNVFPVPDGDTGTNMVLTMQAAYDEIAASTGHNFGDMSQKLAHGALMGARGNSGVILSQILRGFARAVDHNEILDTPSLVKAFAEARDTAYKGVVRPVEGTILTVIKDIASAAQEYSLNPDNPIELFSFVVTAANNSVEHTPELLPVLKEAGVVDAGGKGLFFILEGMLRFINGQSLDSATATIQPLSEMVAVHALDSIEPGQDFEVIVDFRPEVSLDLPEFYTELEEIGTSIQVGEGDGIFRLHIHVPTEKLYSPIDYTRSLGIVTKVTIENLIDQMDIHKECDDRNPTCSPIEPGQIAVVAVAPGAGIGRIFASLGVAALVEGGQTMNPSTQEIIHAFENLPTDKVIILPNNKNILMAAKSAAELTVKQVSVIPSVSVPQGLAAMLRLIPNGDFESVSEDMTKALKDVESGEITVATRSVEIDGVLVKEGQVIALHNGKLVLSATSLDEACLGLLRNAHADHFELITLFFGADLLRKDVTLIADKIRSAFPNQEVEVQEGSQPHYQFIISIE